MIFGAVPRIVADLKHMSEKTPIEVYGHSDELVCAGCEGHGCGDCTPGEKAPVGILVEQFRQLLEKSELAGSYAVEFFESTPENLARNPDVERLLSMAKLEPVICFDRKIAYMGGFSPSGLLDELRKKTRG